MKNPIVCLIALLMAVSMNAQNTFEYEEGDTTYVMQEYYVIYLVSGDNRSQDSTQAAEIQKQHMAHLNAMAEAGHLSMVGPFGDEHDVRGMCIYNTATLEEAISFAEQDPAVQSGRLKVEGRPWWCAKGSALN